MPDTQDIEHSSFKSISFRRHKKDLPLALVFTLSTSGSVHAAKLKPEAEAAWKRYVVLTEARIDREQSDPVHFLWIDSLPEQQKLRVENQLRNGEVVIERLTTTDSNGATIKTPGALVHHWIGTAFIPAARLQQAIALVQDYNNHYKTYEPEVVRSRLGVCPNNEKSRPTTTTSCGATHRVPQHMNAELITRTHS